MSRNFPKQIDYFQKYSIILLVASPTVKWTAKSVSNSNEVTTQMAMRKCIAIINDVIEVGFKRYSKMMGEDDGARLEIMNRPSMDNFENAIQRTGYIHLAFSLGSKEKVDELTSELKKDGYEVISGPRTTGDGYYESCIIGIEGNQIEITI